MSKSPTFLACLEFIGPDAASFLQGYVTADMDRLDAQQALPMACCDIKGRVVASGWAAGGPQHVRMLVHDTVAEDLAANLGKYLPFAKSKLSRCRTGLRFCPTADDDAVLLPPTRWGVVFDAVSDDGHAELVGACVEAGFVVLEAALAGAFLPQMIGLTDAGAVSFSKGCYLGQEVVARAEHRGRVKQRLGSYRFDAGSPTPGADALAGDAKVGTVVAVGDGLALAAVRSDATPLAVNGAVLHRR